MVFEGQGKRHANNLSLIRDGWDQVKRVIAKDHDSS